MSNLGDLKKHFTHILAQAKTEGYKITDILPEEIQDHFKDIKELQAAREYIQEVESREKDLQASTQNLQTQLQEAKAELEIQPADFKSLKVDLQQASRQTQYYKELADHATSRLHRQARKHTSEINLHRQTAADSANQKITDLQSQLTALQKVYMELFEQNRIAAETYEHQRAYDTKIIQEVTSRLAAVEFESETMYKSYNTLIDMLERENASTIASVNAKTMLLARQENLCNVLVSEIAPLNRVFTRVCEVLAVYRMFVHAREGSHGIDISGLSRRLDELVEGARRDLEIYLGVYGALDEVHGRAEEQVRVQMCGLGVSARAMYESLLWVQGDVRRFLGKLESEPKIWLAIKGTSRSE